MRRLAYAAAAGALLAATSAHADVVMNFTGDMSSQVSVIDPNTGTFISIPFTQGGVLGLATPSPAPGVTYGGSATTLVNILQGNEASFTSGVAARGVDQHGDTSGSFTTATTVITALVTNTGLSPVTLNAIGSTIIQSGMGFMVQDPHSFSSGGDIFTGHGVSNVGAFSDFYTGSAVTLATASFDFSVSCSNPSFCDTSLYRLSGSISIGFDGNGNFFENIDDITDAQSTLKNFAPVYPDLDSEGHPLPANGADFIAGYQWDATDINVGLGDGIQLSGLDSPSGNSISLFYSATATVNISSPCLLASDGTTECIVGYSGFGDPVGRGGGTDAEAALFSAFSQVQPNIPSCPDNLTEICFSPQTITPFTLDVTGGGVPEPASWALMITGFGLMGAALRRRRVLSYS